jgi:hypothetical protein
MPAGPQRKARLSKKIEEELKLARKQVPKTQRELLRTKVVITKKLRKTFRGLAAEAINAVVSSNASRMQQLSQNKLRAMKRELRREKSRALKKAFQAFASSPDWRWYPRSSASSSDPLDKSGINQEGRLWKLLEKYATPLKRSLWEVWFNCAAFRVPDALALLLLLRRFGFEGCQSRGWRSS